MFSLFTKCKRIDQAQAKDQLEHDKSIILLDVRTPEEYKEERIPNSINIPLDTLPNRAQVSLKDKDATIFVYCLSGGRSSSACALLSNMGYTNVFNMGGISSWRYDTIHPSR